MTGTTRIRKGGVALAILVLLGGCGTGDEPGEAPTDPPTGEAAGTDAEPAEGQASPPAEESPAAPEAGDDAPATAACDRLTAEELSGAFGVTFTAGTEAAEGICVFDSDGSPQVRLQIYPGASAVCESMGEGLDQVEIAGSPGWWDEAGGQARACLPDESVALTLAGGGGDNSVHRTSVLELLALAAGR